ncbi:TPA: opacity-associated protein OapA [Pasteurella multocida]|nr:opacity-associated protein OapA [Pasteurella multocida]
MDSEKPKNEAEHNPAQNELDLEFSQIEPITPKKVIKPEPSLFDKAKGLFARKEQHVPQFTMRKEPTFSSIPATATSQTTASPSQNPTVDSQPTVHSENIAVAQTTVHNETTAHTETAVHTGAPTVTETVNVQAETATIETLTTEIPQEENPAQNAEQELPPQEQATSQVAAAMAATTAAAAATVSAVQKSWKNPETWPFLQALPQRHRRIAVVLFALILLLLLFFWLKPSTDTVQSFEQQNANAVPIQFQPLDKSQNNEATVLDNLNNPQNNANTVTTENTDAALPKQTQDVQTSTATIPPVLNNTQAPADKTAVNEKPQAVETTKPVEKAPVVEKPKAIETPKTVEQPKAKEKAKVVEAKPTKVEKKSAPVVEAEPAKSTKGKTLTVPQGVSLMQVFRNHNLNIADVNAMTKAKGAGNALSSFKPGDKVQVSVNSQGRVTEMRLENGARFVRQADGSYIYKK